MSVPAECSRGRHHRHRRFHIRPEALGHGYLAFWPEPEPPPPNSDPLPKESDVAESACKCYVWFLASILVWVLFFFTRFE
jgi:hypothetical protein